MKPAPGSFLWLVVHDVRLNWRRFADMLGGASTRRLFGLLACGVLALHLAAWPAVLIIGQHVRGADAGVTPLAIAVLCIFTWMIAQGLFSTTRTLFDRGDLDLLLGAPLPTARILAAKATAIAASTLSSIALLVLPLANIGAVLGEPAWLAAYPTLVALALMATALGLGLSITLFFLVGPRRARTYTQLAGALIAGGFVLGAQAVAVLPEAMRAEIVRLLERAAAGTGLRDLVFLPVHAMQGDGRAVTALVFLAGLLFALAVNVLANRFAAAALAAAGAPAGRERARDADRSLRFSAGLGRNLRRKEWRLLARDPSLFAQLGLQIIYTVPIAVVLLRSEALPTALALAPTIVVIAAQVSASLSWIMVSGEDAPELMATAPVTAAEVDRIKLTAVGLPVLVIIALPLAGLALVSWPIAVLSALFAAAGAASTALLNFWHPMPGNRRGMLRRHSQSKLIALVEHALAIFWAIAIVLALAGSPIALLPVALVASILGFVRRRHRRHGVQPSAARGTTAPPLDNVPARIITCFEDWAGGDAKVRAKDAG
jgi:ABC-2 type transport system permease protein